MQGTEEKRQFQYNLSKDIVMCSRLIILSARFVKLLYSSQKNTISGDILKICMNF